MDSTHEIMHISFDSRKKFSALSFLKHLVSSSRYHHVSLLLDTHQKVFHITPDFQGTEKYEDYSDKYQSIHKFRIEIPNEKARLIKARVHNFNQTPVYGYYLQSLGTYLIKPFKLLSDSWYPNPLNFSGSFLGPQYIMQDLLFTCDLFIYVKTSWYDCKYGMDTLTEKDLYNFLIYLTELKTPDLPIKVTRIY